MTPLLANGTRKMSTRVGRNLACQQVLAGPYSCAAMTRWQRAYLLRDGARSGSDSESSWLRTSVVTNINRRDKKHTYPPRNQDYPVSHDQDDDSFASNGVSGIRVNVWPDHLIRHRSSPAPLPALQLGLAVCDRLGRLYRQNTGRVMAATPMVLSPMTPPDYHRIVSPTLTIPTDVT